MMIEYLVKWTGYPREEATWEPEGNLANAEELIQEFHKQYPQAPQRIQAQIQFKPYQNFTEIKPPKRLFGWEDGSFDREYLERVERKWWSQVQDRREWKKETDDYVFVRTQTLKGR